MTKNDFYKLAKAKNEVWRGFFTEEELKENAELYKVEYDVSIEQCKPTPAMTELCRLLVEDMDKADYEDCQNILDIETMNRILLEEMEALRWESISTM